MEKEFSFINNEGKRSKDPNEFLQEYEAYYRENPEKLQKLKDLQDKNKDGEKYAKEIKEKYQIDIFEWGLKHGVFITAFEIFYSDILNEIENKKNDEDYNSFLIQLKAKKRLIFQLKRRRPLFLDQSKDIDFAISSMEDIQSIIEDELSRLESEKHKNNLKVGGGEKSAKNRILAFNNIDDALLEIKKILEPMNEFLFESSDIKQWEKLLKGEKLTEPIILKKGITHRDIKYFLDEMERNGIWKANYTIVENIGAFWYRRKILTQKQISNANGMKTFGDEKRIIEHKNKDKIDAIISLLSLLD